MIPEWGDLILKVTADFKMQMSRAIPRVSEEVNYAFVKIFNCRKIHIT